MTVLRQLKSSTLGFGYRIADLLRCLIGRPSRDARPEASGAVSWWRLEAPTLANESTAAASPMLLLLSKFLLEWKAMLGCRRS